VVRVNSQEEIQQFLAQRKAEVAEKKAAAEALHELKGGSTSSSTRKEQDSASSNEQANTAGSEEF
jgi:hypothetical protein